MFHTKQRENGFVLVAALLIMIVLTIIGIAATTNTSIEMMISGNDKFHKMAFYEAESGTVLGTELLEQSFNCIGSFAPQGANAWAEPAGTPFRIYERNGDIILWDNSTLVQSDVLDNAKADVIYPVANIATGVEAGYLYFDGETQMLEGGNLPMAAGYEKKGKSAAAAGTAKYYDIYSRYEGQSNSQSVIILNWRHIVKPPLGNIYGWCQ